MRKLILIFLFGVAFFTLNAGDGKTKCGGKCTGSKYCSACKNCNYCKYCNAGGYCGVCRPDMFDKTEKKTIEKAKPKKTVKKKTK